MRDRWLAAADGAAEAAQRRGDDPVFLTLRAHELSTTPHAGAATRRDAYAWWAVLLLTALAPAALRLGVLPGLVAPVFAATCPGYGIVRVCVPSRSVLRACLVVGVSLSLVVLTAQTAAQVSALRAEVVLPTLMTISGGGLALERAVQRWVTGCWRFSPRP
jgi:hypothetical protein